MRGEREHGKMSDAAFYDFPAIANLKEELQDGFWYSEIDEAQHGKR